MICDAEINVDSEPEATPAPQNPSEPEATEEPGAVTPSEPEETTAPETTKAPEETVAPEATKAPEAQPTKKPATGGNTAGGNTTTGNNTTTTTAAEEENEYLDVDTEDFLAALAAKLGLTVGEDAITVEGNKTIVALDEASGNYGGSKLVYYTENGNVLELALSSSYTEELVQAFDAWRKTVTDLSGEEYAEFVKYAKVLLETLLPELDEEEIDELLVAILTSEADGIELTEENRPEFLSETAELLGVLEQEGYEFFLFTEGTEIVLGVRMA